MDIIEQKNILRKIFIDKRKQIDSSTNLFLSQQIAQNFETFFNKINLDLNYKIVGSYMPTRFEAAPLFIEQYLLKKNCQLCFPKIDESENLLNFHFAKDKDNFIYNKIYKQILEPPNTNINIIPDIIIVPLLAFDGNSQRLGMGKGFYDRTIFHLKLKNPKLINIGIAFDFQQSWQALPHESHDLALDFIITNTNSHIQII